MTTWTETEQGNLKDIAWYLKGYLEAKGDRENSFSDEHLYTMQKVIRHVAESLREQKKEEV